MNPIVNEIFVNLTVPIKLWEFSLDTLPIHQRKIIHQDVLNLAREQGDKQGGTLRVQAQMTDWCMHRDHAAFRAISDRAEAIVQQWYLEIARMTLKTTVTACWAVSYSPGQHSVTHSHYPDLFSFVYYVAADETSAPLVFPDPPCYCYQPRAGYGVIFPAWLNHMVPPQVSTSTRVVVAGNIQGLAYRE